MAQAQRDFYRLRWRFDFADKPTKYGLWNLSSNNPSDQACYVNKNGLVRASIEGENVITYELKTFFECDGHDYVTCKGEAFVRVSNVLGFNGKHQPRVNISGISFITRDKRVTVHCNGDVESRDLTAEEKKFKLEEHS